ncbi:IS701 family transposase [Micromonospora sp. 050-3]|uniref:IS701 family transposase n=1 Tax=Micromonospora sp. 050-3 TaxID=2789265 RepID=UPI00397A2A9A
MVVWTDHDAAVAAGYRVDAIAEHAGNTGPDGMQELLTRVKWDDADVRADVREFVGDHLGDAAAVLVIDETGDLKKGRHTVGVQRQYSGTAGKIENCQVAVHLVYATDAGHAMLDTALYLPKSWCDDAERRAEAGVPEQVRIYRVDALAAGLPATAWQRVSAGRGAKGHRYYDWSFTALPHAPDAHGGHHWLLIRRNRRNGELAFYRCWSPEPVPLRNLVLVAGRRWEIEESFQAAKTGSGLVQHQNRRWTSWHRWTTLAILAHAFLAAATNHRSRPDPTGLIALTVNELRPGWSTRQCRPSQVAGPGLSCRPHRHRRLRHRPRR